MTLIIFSSFELLYEVGMMISSEPAATKFIKITQKLEMDISISLTLICQLVATSNTFLLVAETDQTQ